MSLSEMWPHLAALGVTVISALILKLINPRANVIWGVSHQFAFLVPQNDGGSIVIYSRTISILNNGLAPSGKVEVHLSGRPEHYQIWPVHQYTEHLNPENQFTITFEDFGRGEHAAIEILQSGIEPPLVLRVRRREGECKEVIIAPMRQLSGWFYALLLLIMLSGLYFIALSVIRTIW